jgi:hypothetical protein
LVQEPISHPMLADAIDIALTGGTRNEAGSLI